MRIVRRSLLGLVPALALGLAACGTTSISASDLATAVQGSLTTGNASKATVTCAGPLNGTVGATDSCDVTVAGATTGLHVKVDSVDGKNIHWTQQPYLHGRDVAAAVAKAYGVPSSDLTCPDLDGTVGATVDCTVNKGSAKVVHVKVDKVQGLQIHFTSTVG